jgi:hypothetical protein
MNGEKPYESGNRRILVIRFYTLGKKSQLGKKYLT